MNSANPVPFRDTAAQPLTASQRKTIEAALRFPQKRKELIAASQLQTEMTLSVAAFRKLVTNLEGFGNVLSQEHREALMQLVGAYSFLASGRTVGRYAFDLDTGMGKTQSVIAWLAAVHELALPYTVAICASKVEALCDIKRELMRQGVSEDKIGLWHSYDHDPAKSGLARDGRAPGYASLPATKDHDQRQFLLVTHSRVRGGESVADRLVYQGKPRSLVIWDESLLIADHLAVRHADVLSAIGYIAPQIEALSPNNAGKEDRMAALDYARQCCAVLSQELERQKSDGGQPKTIQLPDIAPDALDRHRKSFSGYRSNTAVLSSLFDLVGVPVRVIDSVSGGGAHLTYQLAVPPELNRVAILDASWPIRELERLDTTLRPMPDFNGRVKGYGRVNLNFAKVGAGRRSIEASMREERAGQRAFSQEVAAIVKALSDDQAALVFTFKTHGGGKDAIDIVGTLRRDLIAAGIDLDATVSVNGVARPRIVILTWGNETSLSEFSYATNVIFAGVLQRSDHDLAGATLGQRDDLKADITAKSIHDIKRSEVAHSLYQAISRAACRVVEKGEARATTVWLAHHDPLVLGLLTKAMPGLVVVRWKPQFLKVATEGSPGKIDVASKAIAGHLSGLPDVVTEVSVKALKKALKLTDMAPESFKLARDAALQTVPWCLSGRSLRRLFPT